MFFAKSLKATANKGQPVQRPERSNPLTHVAAERYLGRQSMVYLGLVGVKVHHGIDGASDDLLERHRLLASEAKQACSRDSPLSRWALASASKMASLSAKYS